MSKPKLQSGRTTQLPLFTPDSDWVAPEMSTLPSWKDAKRVAIDCETEDPLLRKLGIGARRGGFICGVSFAIEDGPAHYLPVRHREGPNMDPNQVFAYLRRQAKGFKGVLVGAKMEYDLDYLANEGVSFAPQWFRDVQIAEPLINELKMSYSLESIANDHGLPGKDERLLREAAAAYGVDPKAGLSRLPARFVGPYATQDAAALHPIIRKQERIIEEQDLWNVYNLESELLPVLVKMRRRGVRVSEDRLAAVEQWSRNREAELLEKIRDLTGMRIEVNTCHVSEVVAPVLAQAGYNVPRNSRGASVTKDWMAALKGEVPDAINAARKALKVRTTFCQSVYNHMVNGRIHCTFNQLRKSDDEDDADAEGAKYGRLSCVDPNMQQQPARDPEIGPMWRSIYLPEEGGLWFADDYSQQEPRMAIHFSVMAGQARDERGRAYIDHRAYTKAMAAAQRYKDNPATDVHQMFADMAGIPRKDAKEIYLGITYGMGGAKLCRKLGLPTAYIVFDPNTRERLYADSDRGKRLIAAGERAWEGAGPEGQRLLDTVNNEVPFLKQLARSCSQRAEKLGYIKTLSGRRCRFPQTADGRYDWCHKALNRLVQGSSADQTKRAVIEVDRAGHFLQLQVHDELAGTVVDPAEARMIGDIMEACIPLELPSKVDVEIGQSWGEAKAA